MQRDDTELLTRAKALYDRGRFRVLRGTLEDFYLTCIAWQSIPYAAMQNGSFVGYLVVGADGTGAAEVCGETPELSADLLAAWLSWRGVDNVSVTLMPTDTELLRILSARCEKTWIGMPSNFYLRSWAPLIEALLREKARMVPLLSGRMTVCIGDYGSVEMTVDGANITAIQSAAKPDFTLDALTATRFFGGPLAPNLVTPVPDQAAMLAASWFPLPLSWNGQDRV